MSTRYWIGGSGSQSWSNTANWSGATVPVTGDSVYIRNASSNIDSGLSQSGVLLASLIIEQTFTGRLGDTNGTPLSIGATFVRVGDPGGGAGTTAAGSGAINLDTGTNVTTLEVVNTKSSSTDSGLEPMRWVGANASNAIVVQGGYVGIATTSPTQTATLGTLVVGSGTVSMGAGVTWTSATNAGTLLIQSGNGTSTSLVNLSGGTCTCRGAVYLNTVTCLGGTFYFGNRVASGSSIGTLNLRGGTVDATGDGRTFTVNSTSFRSGTIKQLYETQGTYTSVGLDFTNKSAPQLALT